MKQEFIATNKLLEDFVKYLTEEERSKATIEKYERDVKNYMKFLGVDQTITRESILEYKESMLHMYCITSVNSMLAALNQFLLFIGAYNLRVKRIKVQKQIFREEDRELSEEEYRILVQKAYKEGKTRLALIMETICSTGIRISELQYFTVKAVRAGRIEIFNKGKMRIILVPEQLRKKLLCYIFKVKIQNGSIFVTMGGKPVDRSNIWREMKRLGIDVKILEKKIFPHNLRHLFAVIYYQAFKDIISLADILGHSSVDTTRVYTATTGTEYKRRLESLCLVLK
ncbi:integrase [Clostridium sp. AF19-22AC]|uniref:tyrosine-type recombinase/integrase n=1 Tax=Clostridia TaxID=186801 RepID=UPI000E4A552E|nr:MULTISPECIES: tyrosine-type recombinase/integrase [Clostridia]RHR25814.1 integrase [Clostridium sp. AF19-22AC]